MYQYEYGTIKSLLDIAGIPYKKVGQHRVMGVCPVCNGGHRTPCASYLLDKNIWKCFSCGAGGGIGKLKEYLNLNVNLKNFVTGEAGKNAEIKNVTESIKPFVTKKPDKASISYFENRGIDWEKVKKFVRFLSPSHYLWKKGYRILVPAFDKEGRTRNVKLRNVFPEVNQKVISWKGGENYSIGLNWLPNNAEFVLVVEGEIDFLTVKLIDPEFPVIAVPSANYRFKDELKYLPEKVVVLLDNDESGRYHSERLAKELKEEGRNVEILQYPEEKDMNDLWLKNPEKAVEFLKEIQKGKKGILRKIKRFIIGA